MERARIQFRAGVALLLVLGVLAVGVTVAGMAARIKTARSLHDKNSVSVKLADDVLPQAMAVIEVWLNDSGTSVVLEPDIEQPVVHVLDDQLLVKNRKVKVSIAAWDQYGMLPVTESDEIPSELRHECDGLDQLSEIGGEVFPRYTNEEYGESLRRQPVGARYTTHNGSHDGQQFNINVNTTPILLLEELLRSEGIDATARVIAARSSGQPAVVPRTERDGNTRVTFVGSSQAWAFRVDISVGRVQRSWWMIFQLSNGQWELVQRYLIDA